MNVIGTFSKRTANIELNKLEDKYSIQLPPVFKAFVNAFSLDTIKPIENHSIIHPNENLGFGEFDYDIEELIQFFIDGDEINIKRGMLPFAFSGIHTGGFCVCLDKTSSDSIYIDDENNSSRFVKIADNIIDFLAQLEFQKH